MVKTLFLLPVALIFIIGCSSTDFSTGHPDIKLLIDSINLYEDELGKPPNDLSDLVPRYLDAIPIPRSVDEIEYSLNESDQVWKLTYHAKSGTVCEYTSQSWWTCEVRPR